MRALVFRTVKLHDPSITVIKILFILTAFLLPLLEIINDSWLDYLKKKECLELIAHSFIRFYGGMLESRDP